MLSASIFKSIFDFRIWIPIVYAIFLYAKNQAKALLYAKFGNPNKLISSPSIFSFHLSYEEETQMLPNDVSVIFLYTDSKMSYDESPVMGQL